MSEGIGECPDHRCEGRRAPALGDGATSGGERIERIGHSRDRPHRLGEGSRHPDELLVAAVEHLEPGVRVGGDADREPGGLADEGRTDEEVVVASALHQVGHGVDVRVARQRVDERLELAAGLRVADLRCGLLRRIPEVAVEHPAHSGLGRGELSESSRAGDLGRGVSPLRGEGGRREQEGQRVGRHRAGELCPDVLTEQLLGLDIPGVGEGHAEHRGQRGVEQPLLAEQIDVLLLERPPDSPDELLGQPEGAVDDAIEGAVHRPS